MFWVSVLSVCCSVMKWLVSVALSVVLSVAHSGQEVLADEGSLDSIRISAAALQHDSMELISLVLDATVERFGPYEIKVTENTVQARASEELANNRLLDAIWFATSIEREQKLLPIRIPMDMGLLGYRVCMIKKGSQGKFAGIYDFDSWQQSGLRIGQGWDWPDTKILSANNLRVVTSQGYSLLFNMLRNNRFDCFSRSVIEINNELGRADRGDLTVESSLLFVYPMPTFVFVNKANERLAERIRFGFEQVQQNRTYYDYMQRKRLGAIENLNLGARHVIRLENPYLTEDTRKLLEDHTLWYDVGS